ncbi:winged helix-turn-helix transcriptional regulator [Kitasatospora sp. NPDC001603]|uniref:winged helix-turn-helix transcriptional regulator n=1 Tax=Kitasatospora sp. NPDC001603 TaxID=3154388 RepID=UPI00331FF85C
MPASTSVVLTRPQAQRLQNALSILGPQNTISVLRRLKRSGDTLPVAELAEQTPWMSEGQLASRLSAMEEDGLLTRSNEAAGAAVTLTRAGREALFVQIPFTQWASAHQQAPQTGTGLGAYTEQALATLNRTHSVATIMALAAEGEPVYPSEILDTTLPAGMHPGNLYQRLAQLQEAGIVERTGTARNYLYGLTPAGQALSEPLKALTKWAQRHLPPADRSSWPAHSTSTRVHAPAEPAPKAVPARSAAGTPAPSHAAAVSPSPAERASVRAQAATLRSVAPALVFSHEPAPQPAPPAPTPNSAAVQRR